MAGRPIVEAYGRIRLDTTQLDRDLSSLDAKFARAGQGASRLGAAIDNALKRRSMGGGFFDALGDNAEANARRVQDAMGSMANAGRSLGVGAIGAGVFIGQAALAGLQAGIGALQSFTGQAFEAISSNERLTATFETLVAREIMARDATLSTAQALERAKGQVQELRDWTFRLGAASPFGEEDVARALQMQLGYGATVDEAKRLTTGLIDMAAATGQGAESFQRLSLVLGQVRAQGKLTGQDALQFSNAGFNIYQALEKSTGKSRAELLKLQEQGQLTADVVFKAFYAMTETEPVKGAAARYSQSWAGLAETFGDVKRMALKELGTGTFDALRPYAARFMDTLQDPRVRENLRAIGSNLGSMVKGGLETAIPLASKFGGAIQGAVHTAQVQWDRLGRMREAGLGRTGLQLTLQDLGLPEDLAGLLAVWGDKAEQAFRGIATRLQTSMGEFGRIRAAGGSAGEASAGFLKSLGVDETTATTAGKLLDGTASAIGEGMRRARSAMTVIESGGKPTDIMQALGVPKDLADDIQGIMDEVGRTLQTAMPNMGEWKINLDPKTWFTIKEDGELAKFLSEPVIRQIGAGIEQAFNWHQNNPHKWDLDLLSVQVTEGSVLAKLVESPITQRIWEGVQAGWAWHQQNSHDFNLDLMKFTIIEGGLLDQLISGAITRKVQAGLQDAYARIQAGLRQPLPTPAQIGQAVENVFRPPSAGGGSSGAGGGGGGAASGFDDQAAGLRGVGEAGYYAAGGIGAASNAAQNFSADPLITPHSLPPLGEGFVGIEAAVTNAEGALRAFNRTASAANAPITPPARDQWYTPEERAKSAAAQARLAPAPSVARPGAQRPMPHPTPVATPTPPKPPPEDPLERAWRERVATALERMVPLNDERGRGDLGMLTQKYLAGLGVKPAEVGSVADAVRSAVNAARDDKGRVNNLQGALGAFGGVDIPKAGMAEAVRSFLAAAGVSEEQTRLTAERVGAAERGVFNSFAPPPSEAPPAGARSDAPALTRAGASAPVGASMSVGGGTASITIVVDDTRESELARWAARLMPYLTRELEARGIKAVTA